MGFLAERACANKPLSHFVDAEV
jgi:hypothetical protein